MSVEVSNERPNIRIQINNSMAVEEKMEVDEEEEGEEGEITDDVDDVVLIEDTPTAPKDPHLKITRDAVFTTGINLFDKEEQKKLEERAKRFALKPEEVKNFTEKDLQDLHKSLGITPDNESEVKFNTLHLYGIVGMSPEEILKIFENYAPDGIEYIENNICNVVWLDNTSAARALHYTSKPVNGMPARDAADIFPKEFLDESTDTPQEEGTGQSILLKNNDREVELQQDDQLIIPQKKVFLKGGVDISEIKITIPPGYWRLASSPHSNCLLIRFGLLTDKVAFRSEPFSKYYKKTTSGTKGIISDSKKKEMKTIFERNRDLGPDKHNPWGSIAKEWDKDARYRERTPVMYDADGLEDPRPIEIKSTKMLARLGKRKPDDGDLEDEIEFVEKIIEQKKSKMPRMKMYADEEEERLKRKKMLQKIKAQSQKIEEAHKKVDLRNVLGRTGNVREREKSVEIIEETDLGTRLKNRSQKMVFAVGSEEVAVEEPSPQQTGQQDARALLLERKGDRERRIKIERRGTPPKQKSMARSHRSRREDNGHTHTHSSKRMYSDQLDKDKRKHRHSRVSRHNRSSSYDKQEKPRTRVIAYTPRPPPPKKPTVASTVWSRVKPTHANSEESSSDSDSDSSDDSESESSSSSSSGSDSDSESDSDDSSSSSSDTGKPSKKTTTKAIKNSNISSKNISRPGFDKVYSIKDRLSDKRVDKRSPLKITTTNNSYLSKR